MRVRVCVLAAHADVKRGRDLGPSTAERATDNSASAGNLPLHLEVCDLINETDSGPKDSVAAIRKRLTGSSKNFHIINLTLTVRSSIKIRIAQFPLSQCVGEDVFWFT